MLGALEIVPLEKPADAAYGSPRAQLERSGKPIGGNDLLIAAQALSLGYTVVTENEREFTRVKGLSVENWLRWKRRRQPSLCRPLKRTRDHFSMLPGTDVPGYRDTAAERLVHQSVW